jgi:NDP-sugar pyrophosphorylase family protein
MQKINQIVILNGGVGSRVKSVSKNLPKCLIKFGSKSFLHFQLELIKKKGVKNIVICCGYKSKFIIKELKKTSIKNLGLNITVSVEKKKLGTGGALINAAKYLNSHFFVTYGDSWLDINYKKLGNKLLISKKECIMTVIKNSFIKNHKSNIFINKSKILSYKKNADNKNFKFIDYGLLVMKKESLNKFLDKKKFDLSIVIDHLIKSNKIGACKISKKFYHIGSLEGIEEIRSLL